MRICLFFLAVLPLTAADFEARWNEIKKSAAPGELYRILWDLPKGGDLHNHLTLSISPETLLRAALRPGAVEFFTRLKFAGCPDSVRPFLEWHTVPAHGIKSLSPCAKAEYIPLRALTPEQKSAWISAMILDKPGEGREEFFEAVAVRRQPMARDLATLYAALGEHFKDRSAEGLRYLETQFVALSGLDSEGNPVPPDRATEMLRARLAQPDIASLPLTIRFQFIFVRFNPAAEKSLAFGYDFVTANRDLWVGLNMAGREDNDLGQIGRFAPLLRDLRRTHPGVPLSIHAGESAAPGPQIRETLLAGADRIGHGLNLLSDPGLVLIMRNGKTLIETSLVSNYLLGYTPNLDLHPFPEFLRTGIPTSLSTDDPGVWDSNLTDEFFVAVKRYNLSWSEIVQLGRNSLTYSFADPDLKSRLLRDYDAAIQAFQSRYSQPNWRENLSTSNARPSGFAQRTLGLR